MPSPHTLPGTLAPFLYPCLIKNVSRTTPRVLRSSLTAVSRRHQTTAVDNLQPSDEESSHLNPSPSDYSRTIFLDRADIKIQSGHGGHGCVSFLREKFVYNGPANGGDGGTGGNVYIRAVEGETSLHKLARSGVLKAERGRNGRGKGRNGERGDDLIIKVPVGTVVREISRYDPVAEQESKLRDARNMKKIGLQDEAIGETWVEEKANRDKFVLHPASTSADIRAMSLPKLGQVRRSEISLLQPKPGILLDLDRPSERPILLAAGAVGGLGNPHFVTKDNPRPKFATKGEEGMDIELSLELKLLADVGLVGLPNAGKSTLLRAMSNSRARVGNWAFTTLQPNIGTVVLDNHQGRPLVESRRLDGRIRTNFTIADIPGLIEDAHLDKGLGISFLRHVERARILAFVIDLSAGDAVAALKALWKEVSMYEQVKLEQEEEEAEAAEAEAALSAASDGTIIPTRILDSEPPLAKFKFSSGSWSANERPTSVTEKPWLVLGTKADLPETQENFKKLAAYITDMREGKEEHPSGHEHGWKDSVSAIPISSIRRHGMDAVRNAMLQLIDV